MTRNARAVDSQSQGFEGSPRGKSRNNAAGCTHEIQVDLGISNLIMWTSVYRYR